MEVEGNQIKYNPWILAGVGAGCAIGSLAGYFHAAASVPSTEIFAKFCLGASLFSSAGYHVKAYFEQRAQNLPMNGNYFIGAVIASTLATAALTHGAVMVDQRDEPTPINQKVIVNNGKAPEIFRP